MERQAEQPFLVAAVNGVGQLQKELLVRGLRLVRKRPDSSRVLLDDKQQIRPVGGIRQGDGPVEP